MIDSQSVTPHEARASLDAVDETRNAVVAATRKPAWPAAGFAIAVGLYVGLLSYGNSIAKTVGGILFFAALIGFTLAEARLARAHGEIFDNRFAGAVALRFIPGWIVFGVLATFTPLNWQPWYAIGLGLLAAGCTYVLYRWADNYRAKRLAAGDYNRSDLM